MIKQEHDYRYAVINDDDIITGFLSKEVSDKLKFVNVNECKVGDKYPPCNLDEYNIADVKFINGLNDKEYAFKCYDSCIEAGDVVLVDTAYGYQLATVTGVRVPDGDFIPTKDVVSYVPGWVDFIDRKAQRQMKQAEEEVEATAKKLVDATNVAIKIGCNIDGLKASINRIFGVKDE